MKQISAAVLLSILLLSGCHNKNYRLKTDLASIDFLRGDLILCSGSQFGDVSCKYTTREMFDTGLSLLHSFEYEEAEKVFVQVIDTDPSCAIAYWGVAMSNFRSLWIQTGTDYLEKGSKFLKIAESLNKY